MKIVRTLTLFLGALLLVNPAYAQHKSSSRASSSRPYYGGGKHTASHGGHFQGETNANHKGGHYKNPKSNNQYGKHQL